MYINIYFISNAPQCISFLLFIAPYAQIKEVQSYSMKKTVDLGSLILLEKKITVSILPVRSRLLGKLSKKNVEISINKDPGVASSSGESSVPSVITLLTSH